MASIERIDLSKEITDWKEAVYGEEVRDANVSAFEKIQTKVNQSIDEVIEASEVSTAAAEGAKVAVERANVTIDEAKTTLDAAKVQVAHAGDQAKLSKSFAHGGTGIREGEEEDNSKVYSEKARAEVGRANQAADRSGQEADRSRVEADRASQYANIVAPGFFVDLSTMTLHIKAGVGVDFKVFDDNIFCWRII